MRTIRVKSEEEFTTMVNNYDFRIVEAIVEGALSNLKTKKRFIHILEVEISEEYEVYDLTIDRSELLFSLQSNLKHYENHELYEKCQEIVKAIKYLEKKEKKSGKKVNISYP
tara:strand:- start:323 stop:658 length:336 start_codon:yes stop_codon:yes gene_type:complete